MSKFMLITYKIIGQIPKLFSQVSSSSAFYTKHVVSKTLLSCCQHWRQEMSWGGEGGSNL